MLNLNVGKAFACFPYFPTFSAEPERRESLRLAFPPYFPTFSAEPERRESLRTVLSISLHFV